MTTTEKGSNPMPQKNPSTPKPDGASPITSSETPLTDKFIANTEQKGRKAKVTAGMPRSAIFRALRTMAHRLGLFLNSSVQLTGSAAALVGGSGKAGEAPFKTDIGDRLWPFPEAPFSTTERETLTALYDQLVEYDLNKNDHYSGVELAEQEDERARWSLYNAKEGRCCLVVRVGDTGTPEKRYLLFYWTGAEWVRQEGAPPYDVPMFGEVTDGKPVMIHEGPKAMDGAIALAKKAMSKAPMTPHARRLGLTLARYSHMSWHGAGPGVEVTDWSAVRRVGPVVIWPDMDGEGTTNAELVAEKLGGLGVRCSIFRWPDEWIAQHEHWDCADTPFMKRDPLLFLKPYVCPALCNGFASMSFVKQAAFNWKSNELIYVGSDGQFGSIGAPSFASMFTIPFKEVTRLVDQKRHVKGMSFLPGIEPGRVEGGRINTWVPPVRSCLVPRPLNSERASIMAEWHNTMIRNKKQREWTLDRRALDVARPDLVPQHMVILRGEAGVGKSLFIDAMCNMIGPENAASVRADSFSGDFQDVLTSKYLVAAQELHDPSKKANVHTSHWKDLIANGRITINQKGIAASVQENPIHWWACTNHDRPVLLEHGEDRFFFTECSGREDKKFFIEIKRIVRDAEWLDHLYADDLYRFYELPQDRVNTLTGRAPHQPSWEHSSALTAWQSSVKHWLEERASDELWCFRINYMMNREQEKFKGLKIEDLRSYLTTLGYSSARRASFDRGPQEWLWCPTTMVEAVAKIKPQPIG